VAEQTILGLDPSRIPDILTATWETLLMVGWAVLGILAFGIPLGVLLVVTDTGGILENRPLNRVLGFLVNLGRSFPFIILLVALVPVTRRVMGTTIGLRGAVFPLIVAAIPFMGRQVESALREVDRGLIEAALAMGATPGQVIVRVLLREALPGLIRGTTIMIISLIGYSAMAGAVGGGGLGDLAIRYGYMRFETPVMIATLIILVIMVQLIQWLGDWLARLLDRR